LATDLGRFMDGAPKFIDLRVPSALVAAKTEVETFRKLPPKVPVAGEEADQRGRRSNSGEVLSEKQVDQEPEGQWRFEIVLRRTLPNASEKQTQSPYG